ncbi:unnamed protein product [Dibothriocephalus latus]|uniref:Uncharacterized protein n=1 Tax=Dibothriocephalus latus TaxID=60516 RepID=A0A3P7NXJ6_DIBLA|nr:unnamed protein product [Dibothriocephalus latus]
MKWPAIILLLFNTSSPGNDKFFRNVLCKSVTPPKVETSEQTQTEVTAGDVSTLSDNDGRRYTCLNEFILERGIKIIPWDCTLLKYKMMLATAFRGTRLQQWLQTLNERTEYPVLVAVGRMGSGRVVCSKLDGIKVDLRQTLHWLDVVTKAHFNDYVLPQPSELKAKCMDASVSSVEPSTRLICGAGELSGSAVEKTKGRGLTTNKDTMTVVSFA